MVPSFRRDCTTAVKDAIRLTDTSFRTTALATAHLTALPHDLGQFDVAVDVADAPNAATQTRGGVSARSAQLPISLAVRLRVAPVTFVRAEERLADLAQTTCQLLLEASR
jgi:hypothetical protein